MSDLTGDLLAAVVAATAEKKEAALKVLRGEVVPPPARPMTAPLLLKMGVAAKFLGVSRCTLWRVLQSGKIPKVELRRGSYLVRREDIEALADGRFGITPGVVSWRGRGRPRKAGGEKSEVGGQRSEEVSRGGAEVAERKRDEGITDGKSDGHVAGMPAAAFLAV
jgi:excisionase family DNA binding protein